MVKLLLLYMGRLLVIIVIICAIALGQNVYAASSGMGIGTRGSEVMVLQKILNNDGFIISRTGEGSPGHETDTFSSGTLAALKRFQCAHDIACQGTADSTGYGYVGPTTWKLLLREGKKLGVGVQTVLSTSVKKTSATSKKNKKSSVTDMIKPVSTAISQSDTFYSFYNSQKSGAKKCIEKVFGKDKLSKWLTNRNTTLSGTEVAKVSRCVGYFIQI